MPMLMSLTDSSRKAAVFSVPFGIPMFYSYPVPTRGSHVLLFGRFSDVRVDVDLGDIVLKQTLTDLLFQGSSNTTRLRGAKTKR